MQERQPYKRDKRSPIPKNATVSKVMSRIKGKDTKIELSFRKALYKNGLRGYRANYSKLPGKPDIAFVKKKVLIFIHGCFWHGCNACGRRIPKHNSAYWLIKIEKNIIRDEGRRVELEKMGYNVIVVWEHEIKKEFDKVLHKVIDQIRVQ